MLTIRPYCDDDLDAVVGIARELQAHELALFELMKPPEAIGPWYVDTLREWRARQEGAIFVAEWDRQAAGYAVVLGRVEEDGLEEEIAHVYAEVRDLAVSARFRGRGIGAALLAAAERHARARGRDDFRIGVLAANGGARALYLRCGFADLQIHMRKKLA